MPANQKSIVSLAPRIVAGSSFAGFGFALGRDAYRGAKKNLGLLILFAIAAFLVMGLYSSSVWLSRNYKTIIESIFKKFFALIAFAFCYIIIAIILLAIENVPEIMRALEAGSFEPVLAHLFSSLGTDSFLGISFLIQNIMVFIGFLVGFSQRKKRRQAWQAIKHNAAFLNKHGLRELGENKLYDSDRNIYRLKNQFHDTMEFIAEGRRNKRGYIKYDRTGKYIDWSGMVSIS